MRNFNITFQENSNNLIIRNIKIRNFIIFENLFQIH